MACTLEELQNVEYEILCKFDDFCREHGLKYVLTYGTLLGAIRHNGFIPWDDDIDLYMNYKDFSRFIKLIKKHPIDGLSLSWFDCDGQYPLHIAKLRKDNTYMPEKPFIGLEMNNGVWIDIFMYVGKPKSSLGVKLQDTLLGLFFMGGEKYTNRKKMANGEDVFSVSKNYKFVDKCPDKIMIILRKILFKLIGWTDKKESENIRGFGFDNKINYCIKRSYFEPEIKHAFCERDFMVPENYDSLLKQFYGENYMTPIRTHSHVKLDLVEIDTRSKGE